ncbi:YkgJ family cysteine cluster protein [Salimicrobium flavidum]|uniref:Fe-S-cluster containining protein n=1 Tax=Salimicrobium flavidum TaxID=570947 RepID=A0A1N7JI61_9BACI|nr:YkgJ family cysteine cluster protein [Salimicrobium flavidum]SIS48946.1 Fe-S-cluster containining protein [Salimicrobium flavidum]
MAGYLTYDDILKKSERLNEEYELDVSVFEEVVEDLLDSEKDTERVVLEGFEKLLQSVDQTMGDMDAFMEMKPNCFMGCAFCCYFPIRLSKMEAKLFFKSIEHMDEERKEGIYSHWEGYYQKFADKVDTALAINEDDPEMKLKYKQLNLPCPMLDEENQLCKAYEIRPVPCRTYVNYSDPTVCATQHMPKETFSYDFLYTFYFQAMNELLQALYENGEELPVEYPMDAWSYDYLPGWIMQYRQGELEV